LIDSISIVVDRRAAGEAKRPRTSQKSLRGPRIIGVARLLGRQITSTVDLLLGAAPTPVRTPDLRPIPELPDRADVVDDPRRPPDQLPAVPHRAADAAAIAPLI
jgi:hypothetical protein